MWVTRTQLASPLTSWGASGPSRARGTGSHAAASAGGGSLVPSEAAHRLVHICTGVGPFSSVTKCCTRCEMAGLASMLHHKGMRMNGLR
jgi:hypothetical protein